VKLYDPENAIFERPIQGLVDTINQIIAKEGKLELQGIKESFYLNNMLVKVDVNSLDNVRELLQEMRGKDVGGITLTRPTNAMDLRNFVFIFGAEMKEEVTEEGASNRKLANITVQKWSKIKEKLEKDDMDNPDDQKVDRKKYAMTVYARGVLYVQKYLETVRSTGQVLSGTKAARVVQDLVDICAEQRVHFLGMSTFHKEEDYLPYHQMNVCLTSIVMGAELGFSKPIRRELATSAMFHDSGMALVPQDLLKKRGALSKDEKAEVAKAPLLAVQGILRERALNRTNLVRLVVNQEHKAEFGSAVKDSRGNIQMIIPKANISVYSKIISICCTYDALTTPRPYRDAYGPQIALMIMWTEMRNRFDPELLKVFMNIMAIQPIRMLNKRRQVTME
jgi:HD-GYP domain-containing protein (c-di-GMP phosphodiesterase class II)